LAREQRWKRPFLLPPPHEQTQAERRKQPKRKAQSKAKPRRANRWDRRKLASMYRLKHGYPRGYHYLADDADGRAWLTALLHCGLTDEDAIQCAPWLEPAELPALRREARRLAFDDIGALVGLTFAEWGRFKAWRFYPCDITREEFERHRRERRKEKARTRRQEKREGQSFSLAEQRYWTVLGIVKRAGKITQPELIKRTRRHPPFQPSPSYFNTAFLRDLVPKRATALRQLVHRIVKRLAEDGLVTIETTKGKFGPVLVVRALSVEALPPTRSVMQSGQKMSQLSCDIEMSQLPNRKMPSCHAVKTRF
jgi:hypothetical protein